MKHQCRYCERLGGVQKSQEFYKELGGMIALAAIGTAILWLSEAL